jgi:hypothetical protein
MWMWALRTVPWRTILRHAPTIVEAARGYYAATQRTVDEREPDRPSAGGPDGLRRAVERLEQREVEQAALVADLAKQVAAMTTALEVLRVRLIFALWGAALGAVVALLSIVLLLARG